jgi:hypothetical protein
MEERIIKKLMTSVKCTNCGQNYEIQNVKILGNHHGLWFFSVYCSSCKSQFLIAATVSRDKVAVVSDLTENELSRFKNAGTLTADDVLDMYSFMENFNGDFAKLFKYEHV